MAEFIAAVVELVVESDVRTPEYPYTGQIPIRAKLGRFLRNVTSNPGQNRGFGGATWALSPGKFGPRRQPGPENGEIRRKFGIFGLKTTSLEVFGRKCYLKSGPNCPSGVRAKLGGPGGNLHRDIRGSCYSSSIRKIRMGHLCDVQTRCPFRYTPRSPNALLASEIQTCRCRLVPTFYPYGLPALCALVLAPPKPRSIRTPDW